MNLRDVYVDALNALESGGISLDEFQRRTSVLLDAEPVIRCYKCTHCVQDPCNYKMPYCAMHSIDVQLDDYCSYGERKTGDTE